MPTVITHVVVAATLGQAGKPAWRRRLSFWLAAVFCSVLPDIDVLGFGFGIRYGDLWGHRGLTHSLLFAAVVGAALAPVVVRSWSERWRAALLLSLITASHGLLDALTDGGLGVAFFSPFDTERYFFPWQPLRVSPLSLRRFLGPAGMEVLWTEVKWVWLPCAAALALAYGRRWKRGRKTS